MKKNEAENRMSLDQLLGLMNTLRVSTVSHMFIWDLTSDTAYFTGAVMKRFGETDCVWQNFSHIYKLGVNADDDAAFSKSMEKCISGEAQACHAEIRWRLHDGSWTWIEIRGSVLETAEDHRILLGYSTEIGMPSVADDITGLRRDGKFIIDMEKLLKDKPESIRYVMRIDIDNFNDINSNDGRAAGDEILRELSEIITQVTGPSVRTYRIVSDEFMIVDCGESEQASAPVNVYNKIRQVINESIQKKEYKDFYTISASVMVAGFTGCDAEDILTLTEFAMKDAKHDGKNKIAFFDPDAYSEFVNRQNIRKIMRANVADSFKGFSVFYQPIIDAATCKVIGAEALLRYRDDLNGNIPPGIAVPILEDSGLIIPVGGFVLREALAACKRWRKKIPNFRVNVNLSYVQIRKGNALKDTEKALQESELPGDALTLEVTESGHFEHDGRVNEFLQKLKSLGVNLAVDDFGTGYSNIRYLNEIAPKLIKFDRSFTVNAVSNRFEYTVIEQITELAHSVGAQVCIEGIENADEMTHMLKVKPDMFQGYYFGKPVPFEEFDRTFVKKRSLKLQ